MFRKKWIKLLAYSLALILGLGVLPFHSFAEEFGFFGDFGAFSGENQENLPFEKDFIIKLEKPDGSITSDLKVKVKSKVEVDFSTFEEKRTFELYKNGNKVDIEQSKSDSYAGVFEQFKDDLQQSDKDELIKTLEKIKDKKIANNETLFISLLNDISLNPEDYKKITLGVALESGEEASIVLKEETNTVPPQTGNEGAENSGEGNQGGNGGDILSNPNLTFDDFYKAFYKMTIQVRKFENNNVFKEFITVVFNLKENTITFSAPKKEDITVKIDRAFLLTLMGSTLANMAEEPNTIKDYALDMLRVFLNKAELAKSVTYAEIKHFFNSLNYSAYDFDKLQVQFNPKLDYENNNISIDLDVYPKYGTVPNKDLEISPNIVSNVNEDFKGIKKIEFVLQKEFKSGKKAEKLLEVDALIDDNTLEFRLPQYHFNKENSVKIKTSKKELVNDLRKALGITKKNVKSILNGGELNPYEKLEDVAKYFLNLGELKGKGLASGFITTLKSMGYQSAESKYDIVNIRLENKVKFLNEEKSEVRVTITILPKLHEVKFDTQSSTKIDSQKVEYRRRVNKPENDPTREGYTFEYWYRANDGAQANYFEDVKKTTQERIAAEKAGENVRVKALIDLEEQNEYRVMKDLTLVAKWKKNEEAAPNTGGGGGTTGGGDTAGGGGGGGGTLPPTDNNTTIDDNKTPLGAAKENNLAYMHGYKDGTVNPEGAVTREVAAAIFFRLMDEKARAAARSEENSFTDVKKTDWSNKHISTLVKAGILTGYTDGSFQPQKPITRAELASMLVKFYKLEAEKEHKFSDLKGNWAEEFIAALAKKGWVGGYPDGSFLPNKTVTRAELATIINNVLGRKIKKEELPEKLNKFSDLDAGKWYYEALILATTNYVSERKEDGTQKFLETFESLIEM